MTTVLMYHGIHADERSDGRFDPVYSVRPNAFAAQLDWLRTHDFETVLAADLRDHASAQRVVITFDDGDLSNRSVALPLLVARAQRAEFFVTSDFVGQPGSMRPDDLRALARAGMRVQSHGKTHRYLEDLDATQLELELVASKRSLEDITGVEVDALALPGGRGGARERHAALAAGYRDVLNSVPGRNVRPHPGQWIERIAVTRDMPLETFAALVAWRGLAPRLMQARHTALTIPKRVLGNARYERLRARLLAR